MSDMATWVGHAVVAVVWWILLGHEWVLTLVAWVLGSKKKEAAEVLSETNLENETRGGQNENY